MKDLYQKYRTNPGAIILAAMILAMLIVIVAHPAKAAERSWSGCFGGVFGGYVVGSAMPDGSPVGLASNGQEAGVAGGCDWQSGKMVIGGEVSYAWMFGKLNDLGVDNDLTFTGKAGYLIAPSTQLYAHAGWSRLTGSGFDHVDGWKAGLGSQYRLPDSNMFLDARWTHDFIKESDLGVSGVKIATDAFRIGLNIKFGPGLVDDTVKKIAP
jgi:hypothetical protein